MQVFWDRKEEEGDINAVQKQNKGKEKYWDKEKTYV